MDASLVEKHLAHIGSCVLTDHLDDLLTFVRSIRRRLGGSTD